MTKWSFPMDLEPSSPRFDREATHTSSPQSVSSSAGSAVPGKRAFSDVLKDVERLDCFASCRPTLRTALRQTAWSVAFIEASVTGKPLEMDRKKLDLARMPFDIAAINRLWEGRRYRMAGFTSDKTYRNARWGLRQICRGLGMVVPHRAPQLPSDDPCAPLLAVASSFELATVRRFAAYLADQGLRPESVTNDDLGRYADFLRTELVGVQITPMIRRIVRLWRRAGANHPGWPRTALTPPGSLGQSIRRSQSIPAPSRTKSKRSGAG
jgi:hypothetical protein